MIGILLIASLSDKLLLYKLMDFRTSIGRHHDCVLCVAYYLFFLLFNFWDSFFHSFIWHKLFGNFIRESKSRSKK